MIIPKRNGEPPKENENEDDKGEEEVVEEEEEDGIFSSSAVEATSRFMIAMIYSTIGKNHLALQHLKNFSLTHRLHPNVWNANNTNAKSLNNDDSNRKKTKSTNKMQPAIYRSHRKDDENSDNHSNIGILPKELYNRLCTIFAPKSNYWKESSYSNRGYFSYFMDIQSKKPSSTT